MSLQAPFPWFGGKSRVADLVWQRFGDVPNYVEPFFGSGAVLLARPHQPKVETINDKDGFVANFWRATKHDPDAVAHYADWPVSEADLSARHLWLVNQRAWLTERITVNPDAYDAKIAGWWLWGICSWIGSGWCSGEGPWIDDGTGHWVKRTAGMGINRQRPQLGAGRGINRKRPHLGDAGKGEVIREWMRALSERLRGARVCCGDWGRVLGTSPTTCHGITGVFLDPPYSQDERAHVYAIDDSVSASVRAWAIEHADDPKLRIALCGYAGEHEMPSSWACVPWKACGGYGSQGNGRGRENAGRERIWFSPHCLSGEPMIARTRSPQQCSLMESV